LKIFQYFNPSGRLRIFAKCARTWIFIDRSDLDS